MFYCAYCAFAHGLPKDRSVSATRTNRRCSYCFRSRVCSSLPALIVESYLKGDVEHCCEECAEHIGFPPVNWDMPFYHDHKCDSCGKTATCYKVPNMDDTEKAGGEQTSVPIKFEWKKQPTRPMDVSSIGSVFFRVEGENSVLFMKITNEKTYNILKFKLGEDGSAEVQGHVSFPSYTRVIPLNVTILAEDAV